MTADPARSEVRHPQGLRSGTAAAGGLLTVRIVGLPVAVQVRAQEHNDELTRELTLIAEQLRQRGDHGGLPVRLVALIAELTGRYSMFTAEQERQLAEAIETGADTIDLTYQIPASAAGAAQALADILDEADEYCRVGKHLLTLATPAELVAYRCWFLEEFVRQASGHPPTPWPSYHPGPGADRSAARTATETHA